MSKSRAILTLALAAALFSSSGLFIKVTTVSPLYLFGSRSLVAMVTLLFFVKEIRLPRTVHQIGGMIALAGAQLFFIFATRQTTAANAIFIQFTAPVYVGLFGAWYLGERAQKKDWWAMAAILAGLLIFLNDNLSPAGLMGTLNAWLSGLSLAWFVLFMRRAKNESTLSIALWGNILGAIVTLPLLLTTDLPSWGNIGAILFLGVFQIGLGLVLMSIAIKHLTAIESILIQTLEPILNPIWVFLVIGEQPTVLTLAGGLIVLTAVTWRSIAATSEKEKDSRLTNPT
ncbi:MAG: DMT family transporter [Ardenticatenaceae bacterium]|nr:DMT family transporter [Ardenticatenaceae bacterium]